MNMLSLLLSLDVYSTNTEMTHHYEGSVLEPLHLDHPPESPELYCNELYYTTLQSHLWAKFSIQNTQNTHPKKNTK